jgi:hypothetical protein
MKFGTRYQLTAELRRVLTADRVGASEYKLLVCPRYHATRAIYSVTECSARVYVLYVHQDFRYGTPQNQP